MLNFQTDFITFFATPRVAAILSLLAAGSFIIMFKMFLLTLSDRIDELLHMMTRESRL